MAEKTGNGRYTARKSLVVLMAVVVAVLGLTLAVAGTYALFSDSATVNNHLSAGSLKIGLARTGYSRHILAANGTMTDENDTARVDLTTDASKLFELENIVPTTACTATVEVTNKGTVAFDYGVRILFDSSSADAKSSALAQQLQITVKVGNEVKGSFALADSGSNDVDIGTMLAGSSAQSFTVSVTFVSDDNTNNTAQLGSVSFDLKVYATQKV